MNRSIHSVALAVYDFQSKEYDWDGSGALPLRDDVRHTISVMYAHSFTKHMPQPVVLLNNDGTVDVEYNGETGKKLFLTFKCRWIVTYMKVFEDDQTTIEGVIRLKHEELESLDKIIGLFRWLNEE